MRVQKVIIHFEISSFSFLSENYRHNLLAFHFILSTLRFIFEENEEPHFNLNIPSYPLLFLQKGFFYHQC